MPTIEERLLAKLDRSGECWLFTGCVDLWGYGLMWDSRRGNNSRAHRLAYEIWVGPIADGHDVHHRCGVRACARPEHLEAILSGAHNSMHHRRTHCAQGHPFTGKVRRGQQVCDICAKASSTKWRVANRDRVNERKRARRRAAAMRASE